MFKVNEHNASVARCKERAHRANSYLSRIGVLSPTATPNSHEPGPREEEL